MPNKQKKENNSTCPYCKERIITEERNKKQEYVDLSIYKCPKCNSDYIAKMEQVEGSGSRSECFITYMMNER